MTIMKFYVDKLLDNSGIFYVHGKIEQWNLINLNSTIQNAYKDIDYRICNLNYYINYGTFLGLTPQDGMCLYICYVGIIYCDVYFFV